MPEYMNGINPNILKWARESCGLTVEDAWENIASNIDTLRKWEKGSAAPTYRQLEKLATRYGRPIVLFYFPDPPDEVSPENRFRTLPKQELKEIPSNVLLLIRKGQARQLTLQELTRGSNPAAKKIFLEIPIPIPKNPVARDIATQVRQYLGVTLNKQIGWPDSEEALRIWRDVIQDSGVFVFKAPFYADVVDGFCLFDEEFPLIYLNNSKPKNRQIFTLLHELGHVLLGNNGLTKKNQDYIKNLTGNSKRVEVFCNEFAAECLIPFADFNTQMEELSRTRPLSLAERLSKRYKVSREALLLNMFKQNYISFEQFEVARSDLYQSAKTKGGTGGTFYRNQYTYLGTNFLNLAFGEYYAGNCSVIQLAEHLNLKVKHIPNLEAVMYSST